MRWVEEEERDRGTEGGTSYLDELMGEDEQKKQGGSGPQPSYPGPFGRLLRPAWIMRWAEEEERDRGTEGKTLNPTPGN